MSARLPNHSLSSQNHALVPLLVTNHVIRLLALYDCPVVQKSSVVPYSQYDSPDAICNVKSPQYDHGRQIGGTTPLVYSISSLVAASTVPVSLSVSNCAHTVLVPYPVESNHGVLVAYASHVLRGHVFPVFEKCIHCTEGALIFNVTLSEVVETSSLLMTKLPVPHPIANNVE